MQSLILLNDSIKTNAVHENGMSSSNGHTPGDPRCRANNQRPFFFAWRQQHVFFLSDLDRILFTSSSTELKTLTESKKSSSSHQPWTLPHHTPSLSRTAQPTRTFPTSTRPTRSPPISHQWSTTGRCCRASWTMARSENTSLVFPENSELTASTDSLQPTSPRPTTS